MLNIQFRNRKTFGGNRALKCSSWDSFFFNWKILCRIWDY